LDTWQAIDLDQVAEARILLESAVGDLQDATALLGRDAAEDPAELQCLANGLRLDLARMTRVVDACSAFQNGRAVRLGVGVTYQPTGAAESAGKPQGQGIEA
jgi:hypothetical protein